MSESDSFFSQLMQRRVPQIVGAYVAGLWLAVEIGGWVTEQLGLPSVYALYLFVLLAALLPSVVLLAWRHGQPGPDTWGRPEKLAIPANGLLAIALMVAVVGMRPPEPPPETIRAQAAVVERTLIDEDGEEQVFQVVREGYGVSVFVTFWPKDSESTTEASWESYAAPWLLTVDLDQDPLISGGVIFDRSIIERLKAAGFDGAVGEPLALGLRLAAENASDFLIRGRVAKTEAGYRLEADLHEVENGNLIETVRAEGSTLIAAADLLAEQVGERLVGDLDRGDAPFRPVSLEERTSSNPAVLEPFIRGITALIIDMDFDRAIASLESAVEIDPTFAQGWAWLQQVHRTVGNMPAASAATQQALAHDYKLSTQLRFILRANQYAIGGDIDRAIRVLRMWTEVEPHSLDAWMSLTRNLLLVGEIDEARSANEAAKKIDPDRPSLDRTRANIEELAGNFELASEILESYLDAEPQDAAAWISLGNVRERAGDADGAREAYERAGFVANNDFQAQERLLRLQARAGDPLRALRDFRSALEQPLQPSEETSLVSQFAFLLLNLGRIDEVLELINDHEAAFAQTMAPMAKTLTLEGLRASALTTVSRFDEALERLDRAEEGIAGPFGALFAHARVPILVETDRLDEARAAIERLRALIETAGMIGQDALLELAAAQVEAAQGDYEAALMRLDEADGKLHGTTLSLMAEITEPIALRFAEYEMELGRTESALRRLDDLLARHPNSTPVQLLRARTLHAMQQDDEAREQIDELMDLLAEADADFEVSIEADELDRGILEASVPRR